MKSQKNFLQLIPCFYEEKVYSQKLQESNCNNSYISSLSEDNQCSLDIILKNQTKKKVDKKQSINNLEDFLKKIHGMGFQCEVASESIVQSVPYHQPQLLNNCKKPISLKKIIQFIKYLQRSLFDITIFAKIQKKQNELQIQLFKQQISNYFQCLIVRYTSQIDVLKSQLIKLSTQLKKNREDFQDIIWSNNKLRQKNTQQSLLLQRILKQNQNQRKNTDGISIQMKTKIQQLRVQLKDYQRKIWRLQSQNNFLKEKFVKQSVKLKINSKISHATCQQQLGTQNKQFKAMNGNCVESLNLRQVLQRQQQLNLRNTFTTNQGNQEVIKSFINENQRLQQQIKKISIENQQNKINFYQLKEQNYKQKLAMREKQQYYLHIMNQLTKQIQQLKKYPNQQNNQSKSQINRKIYCNQFTERQIYERQQIQDHDVEQRNQQSSKQQCYDSYIRNPNKIKIQVEKPLKFKKAQNSRFNKTISYNKSNIYKQLFTQRLGIKKDQSFPNKKSTITRTFSERLNKSNEINEKVKKLQSQLFNQISSIKYS